ncbi:MAG: Cof-type HAD-IIB family hydrolase [Oligoflexia bacterium]|nr:Cof-type HAD-IIB family hydrolase [Oligoflexia bacterium]
MRTLALATDYDGTLAGPGGRVTETTLQALRRFKESGKKLILVTGREIGELLEVFPAVKVFDRVVAENGALIHEPASGRERLIAPPADPHLVRRLRAEGIEPLSQGHCVIATREPNEVAVLKAIHELGLELQVIFNKGAVMVLPSGINKATGLIAALDELGIDPGDVAAVGDGENDNALLETCGYAVAVSTALPSLREKADLVTRGGEGAGVVELIEALLS